MTTTHTTKGRDMSVQEAAERLRKLEESSIGTIETAMRIYDTDDGANAVELIDMDHKTLSQAYLAELDPSAISPELLKADGWDIQTDSTLGKGWFLCYYKTLMMGRIQVGDPSFIEVGGHYLGRTMGEIRTVLRLRKLQEARRLSRQSKPSSTGQVGS